MQQTVSITAQVYDPQQWVEEAHLRSGDLFAGIPVDLVPDEVRGIRVSTRSDCVAAEVEADSEAAAFWRLVDYASFLSLPAPALV